MSREIKFRAWHKLGKYMIMVGALRFSAFNYKNYPDLELCANPHQSSDEYYHNVELMQYTGLRDKNGKDVYEGDIVNYKHNNWKARYKISFYNGAFVAEYLGGKGWREVRKLKNVEVIGNIYENPELLAPTSERIEK